MTLLILTLWILITLVSSFLAFKLGRKIAPRYELSEEEKRIYEKEKRELENFWTYNGQSQH